MMTEPPEGAPAGSSPPIATGIELPPPEQHDRADETDERAGSAYLETDNTGEGDGGRVIAGVAFEIAARIGVDPLWVRLAFVGLALASGLGVLVYAGLWLLLIVGDGPRRAALRWLGVAVLGASALLVLNGETDMIDGPVALAAVLVGVAVALWQPRGAVERSGPESVPTSSRPRWTGFDRPAREPRRFVRREPSVLGRATLGAAIIVASVGLLIDQLNGGRLHPEQWLGAAAAVCGLGLVVGSFRGRAMWLVLPSLAFAATGFVAGHAARAGVEDWEWGESFYSIGPGWVPPTIDDHIGGHIHLEISGVPDSAPHTARIRMGIGDVEVYAAREVTVEIRPRLSDGSVELNGVVRPDDAAFTIGPDGPPDVIVDATISTGNVFVRQFDAYVDPAFVEPVVPTPPWLPLDPGQAGAFEIGERLTMASDGTVIFPDGAGAIGPEGQIWVLGDQTVREDGVVVIFTPYGEQYLVLPNQMIIAPSGLLVDVPALRLGLVPSLTTPTTSVAASDAPVTTVVPAIPATPSTLGPSAPATTITLPGEG